MRRVLAAWELGDGHIVAMGELWAGCWKMAIWTVWWCCGGHGVHVREMRWLCRSWVSRGIHGSCGEVCGEVRGEVCMGESWAASMRDGHG